MRFENRSWLLLATGVMASAAVAACSADAGSGSGIVDDDSGAEGGSAADGSTNHDAGTHDSTSMTDSSTMDATHADTSTADTSTADTSAADTSTADTSSSDTGTADASVDSGLPPVGSACSPQNSTQQQPCGLCGVQNRVCLAPDGGTPVWQQWGFCQNEVANGCVPTTQTTEACGLCGMRQKVCQNDCTYAVGACTGQPMNACAPGSTDYEPGLSCDAGGRTRTCGSNCTFGNFGNCGVPEGGTGGVGLTIGGVGATVFGTFTMAASPKLARMATGTCPKTTVPSGSQTSYSYVAVYNPTSSAHTVSIWNSRAPGASTDTDTVMTAYASMTAPVTPAEREVCMPYVNDTCDTAPCPTNQFSWAGLIVGGDGPVTIPANTNVIIYTAAYFTTDSGDYQLNARTEN